MRADGLVCIFLSAFYDSPCCLVCVCVCALAGNAALATLHVCVCVRARECTDAAVIVFLLHAVIVISHVSCVYRNSIA